MVPPASTSSRRKRNSVINTESSSDQHTVKRPRSASAGDRNVTEQDPVSSPLNTNVTLPVHSNNSHSDALMKIKHPADKNVSIYQPTQQTIFLGDDFRTMHWKPVQSQRKHAVNISKHIERYGNDIHSYFISEAAGRNAAALNGPISSYRHIGHIVLHKFQLLGPIADNLHLIPSLSNPVTKYVNMRNIITHCRCENRDLLETLDSLANPEPVPWPAPLIVIISGLEDVLRTAGNEAKSDIKVQVYVGRLLFELISNIHIRTLFTVLRPTVPFKSVTHFPVHNVNNPSVAQNPDSHRNRDGNTFSDLLRGAESPGYDKLTPGMQNKIHNALTVKLYGYQEQTVQWMLDKENSSYVLNDYFWEERCFTDTPNCKHSKFYYFPMTGEVRLLKPPSMRGGMIAEESGLGKTVEALALIAAQKSEHLPEEINILCEKSPTHISVRDGIAYLSRQRTRNLERSPQQLSDFHHGDEIIDERDTFNFPTYVRVRRWPAKTTLIICPKALIGQWKQEALKIAPGLSLEIWSVETKINRGSPLSVAVGENAKDIVIATYDMIRSDATLSKICWKRLILDESQVVRRSAAQVSNDVLNLRCDTRFLMTGTPLVNSINDLKGQLAFLKIWPFCLEQDGFWDTFVNYPFRCGCPIPILKSLLRVIMMRHSRAQLLRVLFPLRSYETIKVSLKGSYRACYYFVLASCFEELEMQALQYPNTRRLRTLLKLHSMLWLSPYLLDFESLDTMRRLIRSGSGTRPAQTIAQAIRKVSAQEAIQFMGDAQPAAAASSSQDVARQPVLVTGVETFMRLPVNELIDLIVSRKLLTRVRASRTSRERLAAIAAGGVHRLDSDSVAELRRTAINLGLGTVEEVSAWSRDKACTRLKEYYENKRRGQVIRSVHESGLSAITKLIERQESPNCPVCLTDCNGRIAATRCGHLYCFECMTTLLESVIAARRCAICRRALTTEMAVEILRDEATTQAEVRETKSYHDKIVSLLEERVSNKDSSSRISIDALVDKVEAGQSSGNESSSQNLASAKDCWGAFEKINPDVSDYNWIEEDEQLPSLSPKFLRHLAATRRRQAAPPKLAALRTLILSNAPDVKFCVVAGSVQSLREIARFLESEDVGCVGAGATSDSSYVNSHDLITAGERFSTDPDVRVFLLNPTSATGLTLTAASVIVLMETLPRVADEAQAVARVHRVGQTRFVKVIRIIAEDTLEEKIVAYRGEFRHVEQESQALASASNIDAADGFILRLFGR